MIVAQVASDIETSGMGAQVAYTIKSTAKSFKILSDGLYSDKIGAVVREYACNAYDSHVAAGRQDVPVEIGLPTGLNPEFYVKDFGIGLSAEQVYSIFTTYFESTKSNSNDFIGALGLGSKSAFSYTDSFTITSVYDGKKSVYIAFIAENGVPSIMEADCNDTDEPNGVTISLQAKSDDISKFHKAMYQLRKFSPIPNVIGLDERYFNGWENKENVIMSGTNWEMIEDKNDGNGTSFYAIQGNVIYPIDARQIETISGISSYYMNNKKFYITFNIGELDVSASRESLSYDKATIANINARTQEVIDEFAANVSSEILGCDTYFGACLKYAQLSQLAQTVTKSALDLTYGDDEKPIKNYLETLSEIYNPRTSSDKTVTLDLTRTGRLRRESNSWSTTFSIRVTDEVRFLFIDTKIKRQGEYVKAYAEKHLRGKRMFLSDSSYLKHWLEDMGAGHFVVNVSSLPDSIVLPAPERKAKKIPGAPKQANETFLRNVSMYAIVANQESHASSQYVDLSTKTYYIRKEHNGGFEAYADLANMLARMGHDITNKCDAKIVILTELQYDRLKGNTNVEPLMNFFQKEFTRIKSEVYSQAFAVSALSMGGSASVERYGMRYLQGVVTDKMPEVKEVFDYIDHYQDRLNSYGVSSRLLSAGWAAALCPTLGRTYNPAAEAIALFKLCGITSDEFVSLYGDKLHTVESMKPIMFMAKHCHSLSEKDSLHTHILDHLDIVYAKMVKEKSKMA